MPSKILVVEDTSSWAHALTEMLARISDVEVDECSRPEQAMSKTRSTLYDVYFVDLKLGEQQRFEGIGLIQDLRQANKGSVIVAYSSEIPRGASGAEADECRKVGADRVFSRADLHIMGPGSLKEMMDALRLTRDEIVDGRPLIADEGDVETQVAKEVIEERNIKHLLRELIPLASSDTIRALNAGYSGAFVLAVESDVKATGVGMARTVVKISRSAFALENEIRRRPFVGSTLDASALPVGSVVTRSVNGWHGIVFRQITDAKPLAKYLHSGRCDRTAKTVLNKLVDELVVRPARNAEPMMAALVDEYRLTWRSGASLLKCLTELQRMDAVVNRADRNTATDIASFVHALLQGKHNIIGRDTKVAGLHGDLHADNIFVADNRGPVVIDFERADVYPRLFDAAALTVDLLLLRLDAHRGNDWKMARVDDWTQAVMSVFPFDERTRGKSISSTERIYYLLHRISVDIASELEHVTAEEYGRALLFQLARYLKFPNVTIPKRVFGVRLFKRLLQVTRSG